MVQVLEVAGQLVQLVGAGVGLYTAVVLARRAYDRRGSGQETHRPPHPDAGERPTDQTDRA